MSRSVEYGLIALDYLSSQGNHLVKARELSESLGLPRSIIAKVLQRLGSAEIIISEQGARGGYRLSRDLATISMLDLSQAIEGEFQVASCVDDGACDRQGTCTVAGPVAKLDAKIAGLLSSTSLRSLLRPGVPEQEAAV